MSGNVFSVARMRDEVTSRLFALCQGGFVPYQQKEAGGGENILQHTGTGTCRNWIREDVPNLVSDLVISSVWPNAMFVNLWRRWCRCW